MPSDPLPSGIPNEQTTMTPQLPNDTQGAIPSSSAGATSAASEVNVGTSVPTLLPAIVEHTDHLISATSSGDVSLQYEQREKRAEIERQIREKKVDIEGKERDLTRVSFEIRELELEVKHAQDALNVVEGALKAAELSVKKDDAAIRTASEGLREKDQLLYRSRLATEKLIREINALKSTIATKEHELAAKNEERRGLTRKRALAQESLERARYGVRMEKAHVHDRAVEVERLTRLPKTPANALQKERVLAEQRRVEQELRKHEADERKFSEEVRTTDRALLSLSDALTKLEREITALKKEIEDKETKHAAEVENARLLTRQKETTRQRFEAGSFSRQADTTHVAEKQVEFARYANTVKEKLAALEAKKREKNRIERAIFELKQDIEQLQNTLLRHH